MSKQEKIKTEEKSFTIIVTQDAKGRSIRRKNTGFETFELLGHLYSTISEIEARLRKNMSDDDAAS